MLTLNASRMAVLDGLRGLAVLLVLVSHWSGFGLPLFPGLDFAGLGKPGVYLFFVLSAWLLSYRALLARGAGSWTLGFWLGYAIRRLFRILPLYYLVLAFSVWMTHRGWGLGVITIHTDEALRHALMLEGRSVFWAIPVEFSFYACLPFLLICWANMPKPWAVWAWGVCLFLPILLPPAGLYEKNTTHLWAYWPAFMAGLGLALAAWKGWLASSWISMAPWLSLVAGLLLLLSWPQMAQLVSRKLGGPALEPDSFHGWVLPFGLLWSFILAAALTLPRLNRALAWPGLVFMGRVSFSAYLWHLPVLRGTRMLEWPSEVLAAWVALGVTLALAWVSFLLVERPAMALGRRLTAKS